MKLTLISFYIAIAGVVLAALSLFLQWRDKPRLSIVEIRPCVSGSRALNAEQWNHQISSIEVIVENEGSRAAIDCEAIITFPYYEALPLHPQTRESLVDIKSKIFNVQPESKVILVGAWNYAEEGAIDGTKNSISLGDFLQKCTPATVKIKFGKNNIQSVLSTDVAKTFFEKHQSQVYLGND